MKKADIPLPKMRFLEELAEYYVFQLNEEFKGDGCSFFVKEKGSVGRFRLIATTGAPRFVGTELIDAYDKQAINALPANESLKNINKNRTRGFGITKYAIRKASSKGIGYLSSNVKKDHLWSAQLLDKNVRDRRCMEIHCERLATDLLSFMAAPLLSKARKVESSDNPFDPIGLIRIVRSNENEGGEFTKKDLLNFQKKVKRITPFFETAVSISSLATLGDATIETGKFWQEVIERISTLIRGTGASVFERDETVENENNIRFVCKAATKLFNDKGDEIDEAQIANSKICYEESVDEPAKSFTMWVVKHGRSVVVARTYVQEEFEQYPDLIRKPGRGKFNESPDDISIIMVPVMSIDKKNVDAVIRIAKERKTKDDRFSNEEIKLFMSVIPAISLIFNTARRLELLESLGKRSVNDIKSLYREVVR